MRSVEYQCDWCGNDTKSPSSLPPIEEISEFGMPRAIEHLCEKCAEALRITIAQLKDSITKTQTVFEKVSDDTVAVTRLAASLAVLIEGMNRHTMTPRNVEKLSMEIVRGIRDLK
jgi:hypothetical protein